MRQRIVDREGGELVRLGATASTRTTVPSSKEETLFVETGKRGWTTLMRGEKVSAHTAHEGKTFLRDAQCDTLHACVTRTPMPVYIFDDKDNAFNPVLDRHYDTMSTAAEEGEIAKVGRLSLKELENELKSHSVRKLDVTSSRCYLRTADLTQLCSSLQASSHEELDRDGVLYSHELTKGSKHEPERWIALDDTSPENVVLVTEELVRYARSLETMDTVWEPAPKTAKLLKKQVPLNDKDVWMWIGNLPHQKYGHDIPCVKSKGLVNQPPKHLAELLMDSTRVKSYNKNSQGRADKVVWQEDVDTEDGKFGKGETKVTRSTNKAPMVKNLLEFIVLLHGRRLEDGSYLVVARTVSGPVARSEGKPTVSNEVLLNVHLLKPVEGNPNQTEMININHLKSPLVPMMVAKRLGLKSATDFLDSIRAIK